jgi:hypothetical protein
VIVGFIFLVSSQMGSTNVHPLPALKSPVLKIKSFSSETPTEVGRTGPWLGPGYYQAGTIYRINLMKADAIRKKLVAEGFKAEIRGQKGRPPTSFTRETTKVTQYVNMGNIGERGSEYVRAVVTESPVMPQGLKDWPKPLWAPKPPLSQKLLYPFPFLKSFTLESVTAGEYKGITTAVVSMTSKTPFDKMIKQVDKALGATWLKSPTDKLIRYMPNKRFESGPYQLDIANYKGNTAVTVSSRIVSGVK